MESSDDAITSCASTGASACLSMPHLGNNEVTCTAMTFVEFIDSMQPLFVYAPNLMQGRF